MRSLVRPKHSGETVLPRSCTHRYFSTSIKTTAPAESISTLYLSTATTPRFSGANYLKVELHHCCSITASSMVKEGIVQTTGSDVACGSDAYTRGQEFINYSLRQVIVRTGQGLWLGSLDCMERRTLHPYIVSQEQQHVALSLLTPNVESRHLNTSNLQFSGRV